MSASPLRQLARQKAQEYAQRDDLIAVAITGSVARGTTWAGSDVDLWAFTRHDDPDFEDGVENDLYWEIDIKPLAWLETAPDVWLRPPALENNDGISPLEALWGCEIIKDEDGTLTRLKQTIDQHMADAAWLHRRAENYLTYGRGVLEGLFYADPLRAMVLAREVAVKYGVAAYWMKRGRLMSSGTRIPEQLADTPDIHYLFRLIYALNGKATLDEFFGNLTHLNPDIQKKIAPDLENEVKPAYRNGNYEGALVYMRQGLPRWFSPYEVLPILGIPVNQVEHRARLLPWVWELLEKV